MQQTLECQCGISLRIILWNYFPIWVHEGGVTVFLTVHSFNAILFFLVCHRTNVLIGQCFRRLWSNLPYWQLQKKSHHHQFCLLHQDRKTVEPEHTFCKPVLTIATRWTKTSQRERVQWLGRYAPFHLPCLFWAWKENELRGLCPPDAACLRCYKKELHYFAVDLAENRQFLKIA